MWTTTGKAKHNERRRENRLIRRHAADWAAANGQPELAEQLRQMNPGEVKAWLIEHHHNPRKFVDEVPATPLGDLDPTPIAQMPPAQPVNPAPGIGDVAVPGRPGPGLAPTSAAGSDGHEGRPAWFRGVWCSPELQTQIQTVIDTQGGHRDERSLLSGTPERRTLVGAGINTTYRVELDNGMVGFFKPFEGYHASAAAGFGHEGPDETLNEAAAWQLASRLGPPYSDMVPPVVLREVNGEWGSLAVERPGKTMVRDVDHSPEWREAALFDSLIGQQDRHPGNYLVAGDRITLIDHGFAFARPGDYQNFTWFVTKRAAECPELTYQERDVLQRFVASPDLMGTKAMIGADRAAAMRDRATWMLQNNEILTSY